MIKIENLYKSFKKNRVLKGINLQLKRPGITAILGPNGSGKTTLIKSILGMVIPENGRILIDEHPIRGEWQYRNKIDYLPQIARFPENLRVNELLQMIQDLRPAPANATSLIDLLNLGPFLNQPLGTLSGGTRQKVNLVQALMYDSPLLIMDEPTVGLDPLAMVHLRSLLEAERAKGKIILISTHIMSFVEEMADDLIFLSDGKLHFQGTVDDLKKEYQEDNLEKAIARILQGETPAVNISAHLGDNSIPKGVIS